MQSAFIINTFKIKEMNRQIKFRIWVKDENKMVYPDKYVIDFSWFGVTTEHYLDDSSTCEYPLTAENYRLMQYSGIDDKNGKEIYEGDIFKLGAEKEVFEVRFEHGCFMAFCNGKQYGLIGELQICFIDIIGNIHENAGLL